MRLVGSQRVVLESLGNLIAREPDLKVLDGGMRDASHDGLAERPDVALVDLDETDSNHAFQQLADTARTTRTIALSIATDPATALRIFQAGGHGLVSKRQPPSLLLMAIRKVHAGEAWIGRTLAMQVLDLLRTHRRARAQAAATGISALSAHDRHLISLVAEGWKNADIARHLMASEAAVRASLTAIFRKLGLQSRFALMVFASRNGFVGNYDTPRARRLFS